ncbi:hypothetical protein CCYA_CCYA12G3331 [Cyanidiococcus yangmingshanensis]|nr:hypothetical protein CCYA_CCYA12G3331 [Cyanidiococcus yangmingshanensis]
MSGVGCPALEACVATSRLALAVGDERQYVRRDATCRIVEVFFEKLVVCVDKLNPQVSVTVQGIRIVDGSILTTTTYESLDECMRTRVQPGYTGILLTTGTGRSKRAGSEALEELLEHWEQTCELGSANLDLLSRDANATELSASTRDPAGADPTWSQPSSRVSNLIEECDTGVRNTVFLRFTSEQAPAPALLVKLLFEQTRKQGYVGAPACESLFPVEVVCKAYPRHVGPALTDHISRWLQPNANTTTTQPVRFAVRFRSRNNDRVHAHDFIDAIVQAASPLFERSLVRVDLVEPDVIVFAHVLGKLCYLGAVSRELVTLSSPRLNIHACISGTHTLEKRTSGEIQANDGRGSERIWVKKRFRA